MSTPDERDYQPIEAYALLGNCEGCALVARDGSLDWACLERFDADPSFSRLLDRLLVTTAYEGMDNDAKDRDPEHGRTLLVDVGVRGLIEPAFRLAG